MRAVHVIPGIKEQASGPTYSVLSLCRALIDAGNNVTLATLDWGVAPMHPDFVRIFPRGMGPRRLGRSPALLRWLTAETAAGTVDIVHSHGMWQMSAIYPGWAAKGHRSNLVISPRGAFSAWAMNFGSPYKKVFWPVVQRPVLNSAACFHATAHAELSDIRRLGFKQPVAVIPNGIDVPPFEPKVARATRRLLFLGRIHPSKGVDVLLNAWAAVMDRHPEWHLDIAGTSAGYGAYDGYLDEMMSLAERLKLRRVAFVGPLYGEAKLAAYRNADLFVLPTRSENFGVTVAEALAAGTPAIVTNAAPWGGLREHNCGWWIDIGTEPLIGCLEQALASSKEALVNQGIAGREWMNRDFTWHEIASMMNRTYEWVCEGGMRPSWIRDD